MSRRVTQNEIIAARRASERFSATARGRALRRAIVMLPKPVSRWILMLAFKRTIKSLVRRGATKADLLALLDDVRRRKEEL